MRLSFFLIAASAVIPGTAIQLSGQSGIPSAASVSRVVDSLATDFIAANSPSVAIAVVRGRDSLVFRAWGTADLATSTPASSMSVYRIGSVTKQFTAAVIMQLVERNRVHLDDSIATYLPSLPAAWHVVTVRQLLNHTSGIPDYTHRGAAWMARWPEEMTPATIAGLTATAPMDFAPGSRWQYDNSGYVVLGMLIEKVTGHDWATEVADRLTRPLGLAATKPCTNEFMGRDAHGYERGTNAWVPAPYLSMSQPYAAGSLCSTLGDLAKWNRALHGGKVVTATSYALMTTPSGAAAQVPQQYGFGLGRDSSLGRIAISHGGAINGFITANMWVPSAEMSVTVLTNAGGSRAEALMLQVARAALGLPLKQHPVERPIVAAERAKFLGVYALKLPTGVFDLTFAEAGEQVTAQLAGQGATPLRYFGDNTFGVSFDPSVRFVFTVEGVRATKVVLQQGGARFEGARK